MSGETFSVTSATAFVGVRTDSGNNLKPPPETAQTRFVAEEPDDGATFTPSEAAKNSFVRSEHRFDIDNDLDKLVVKIVNSESGELIRQIPSEEALNLMKRILEVNKL